MRLFFAIELPDDVRDALETIQLALRRDLRNGMSWVRRENLHITMRFLGECGESQLDAIADSLKSQSFPEPFTISFPGLMLIPPAGRTRVLAAEVEDATDSLAGVFRSLESAAVAAGFRPETRFLPHATLARVRPPCRLRLPAPEGWTPIRFDVSRIALIRSTLAPAGSTYRRIGQVSLADHRFALGDPPA